MKPKILVIGPAYNEAGNISATIQEISSLHLSRCFGDTVVSVLVVNDGSSDATAQHARKAGALVVSLPFNLGIGGAVQTGFKFAREQGFHFAVQVDGDGQHDVAFLEAIIRPVFNGEVDMTIGSRFLPPP